LRSADGSGDFYLEHYNFELAPKSFDISCQITPSDEANYRLAKIHLLEGRAQHALEHLIEIEGEGYATRRLYWEAAAQQQLGNLQQAGDLLAQVALAHDGVPEYLLALRRAINLELAGNLDSALELYSELAETSRESVT